MSKLSFEALIERAAATNQEELLNNVSGGTFGGCHCQGHAGPTWYDNGQQGINAGNQMAHLFLCDPGSDYWEY